MSERDHINTLDRRIAINANDPATNLLSLKEILSNRIFQLAKAYMAESNNTNNEKWHDN